MAVAQEERSLESDHPQMGKGDVESPKTPNESRNMTEGVSRGIGKY